MLLFSATFEDSVWQFAERVVPDPNIIRLKREEETLDTIKQYYVHCGSKRDKFDALCNIYGAITIAQAMIFCHVCAINDLIHTQDVLKGNDLDIHATIMSSCCRLAKQQPGCQTGWQQRVIRWRC